MPTRPFSSFSLSLSWFINKAIIVGMWVFYAGLFMHLIDAYFPDWSNWVFIYRLALIILCIYAFVYLTMTSWVKLQNFFKLSKWRVFNALAYQEMNQKERDEYIKLLPYLEEFHKK